MFDNRIDGEATVSSVKGKSKKAKPVSDLTGFDVTHTVDQMGPIGYRRVMAGNGKLSCYFPC